MIGQERTNKPPKMYRPVPACKCSVIGRKQRARRRCERVERWGNEQVFDLLALLLRRRDISDDSVV
jgi:hypothetical protein